MTEELWWLALATATFILLHTVVSSTALRAMLVDAIGEGPYLALFSLEVTGALVWMSMAYAATPHVALWESSRAVRLAALAAMAPVMVLLVAGLTARSPTGLGRAGKKGIPEARGILRIKRHPVLWALLVWSAVHVLVNGDIASLLFFGGFLLLSAAGPRLIDRKRGAALGDDWESFAEVTSNLPFAAIIAGRNSLDLGEIGWKNILLGLALYVIVVSAHAYVIGVGAY